MIKEFENKRITVMGLGVHGGALGNVAWLVRQGAKVLVTDLKREEELGASIKKIKELGKVELVLGEHREKDFTNTDMVLRNPAVPRGSKYLKMSREAGVPVEMDSSLFFKYWPRERIIGVTGSKGKSTTTKFISDILRECGTDMVTVGMEGTAVLSALDQLNKNSWAVFELSSWRLEALAEQKTSPGIAVITSLYRDHLNTYSSFEEYAEMKKTIIKYQQAEDAAIINFDDPALQKWEEGIGRRWGYTKGLLRPSGGIGILRGKVSWRHGGRDEAVFDREIIPFQAEHEILNVLPAVLIAKIWGIDNGRIAAAVHKLKPLPHRMELAAEIGGVSYINDSAATIPDAVIAALRALAGKKVIHIIGGSDKELEFEELAEHEAKAQIKALIYLPGKATEKIKQAFGCREQLRSLAAYDAASMDDAVARAVSLAEANDVVILSPGATSFGLFKHEFDRGEKFKQAVSRLLAKGD